jgi:hypothetical protein
LATALVIVPLKTGPDDVRGPQVQAIVVLDHCLLGEAELKLIKDAIAASNQLAPEQILITFTHTHGAGLMSLDRAELPGGELIEPYLRDVAHQSAELVAQALYNLTAAIITYGYGHCSLAANRDFWDEERKQFVCGFNPKEPADDTLLVARFTSIADHDRVIATLVNYACHPTTLAWENQLISPDYIGALRELVERETTEDGQESPPCIFLQGASAELGPRDGYTGDVDVADANGRQLAYSALAAMSALPPPRSSLVYQGPKVSGATLGIWRHERSAVERMQQSRESDTRTQILNLPYRTDRTTRDQVAASLLEQEHRKQAALAAGDKEGARDAHALIERQTRMLRRLDELPPDRYPYLIQAWRLGDAIWLGVKGELYSRLQTELRQRFAPTPIVVITLVDGWGPSYVVPQDTYGTGRYQESVAVLAPGSFEEIIAACSSLIHSLLNVSP